MIKQTRFLSFLLVASAAVLLSACASTKLKPEAAHVVVSDNPPSPECKNVGSVQADTKVNVANNADSNVLENLIKNRAHEIGGNYVKLDVHTSLAMSGPVYSCPLIR